MSEIQDRQDAVSDIAPIATIPIGDTHAAAVVEGAIEAAPPADASTIGDDLAAETAPTSTTDIADAIEAALLPGDDRPDPAFEHISAAYADTVVELDAGLGEASDDAPLLDGDLEDGIASVFAALHAAAQDATPVELHGDVAASDVVTFRLLGELDRLWHRAA